MNLASRRDESRRILSNSPSFWKTHSQWQVSGLWRNNQWRNVWFAKKRPVRGELKLRWFQRARVRCCWPHFGRFSGIIAFRGYQALPALRERVANLIFCETWVSDSMTVWFWCYSACSWTNTARGTVSVRFCGGLILVWGHTLRVHGLTVFGRG